MWLANTELMTERGRDSNPQNPPLWPLLAPPKIPGLQCEPGTHKHPVNSFRVTCGTHGKRETLGRLAPVP